MEVEGVLPGVGDQDRGRALADVALVVVGLLDDQASAWRFVREAPQPEPSVVAWPWGAAL
ncbi:hypothetical protein AQJ46_43070 [Streptomyces canus]|uniref:Uncharacterized protein n=1 Tax=Streptomyces canus TaxID=58343 RepID=A0A101RN05_9ACTN|nr:hypothetical protein AQJ46_43070 [Streptomyces canus]